MIYYNIITFQHLKHVNIASIRLFGLVYICLSVSHSVNQFDWCSSVGKNGIQRMHQKHTISWKLYLGKLSKKKTTKHMEFSICWLTPSPPTYGKSSVIFLLSKNDFWLLLRLFNFFPLKVQKYLENFHDLVQRVGVEGGGH